MTGSNTKAFTIYCNDLGCELDITVDYTWSQSKSKVTGCCSELQDPDEYTYDIDSWDVDATFYDDNGNVIINRPTTKSEQAKIVTAAEEAIYDYIDNLTWEEVEGA